MIDFSFPNTVSARDIQRGYTKVFNQVRKSNKPTIVLANNKPQAAIISMDMLTEISEILLEKAAWKVINRTRDLNKNLDFDKAFKDITKAVEEVRAEMYAENSQGLS